MPTSDPSLLQVSPRASAARDLRRWIEEGRFAVGAELPSERALCSQFELARGTVRAALTELERAGLISGAAGRIRRVLHQAKPRSRLLGATVAIIGDPALDLLDEVPSGQDIAVQLIIARALKAEGLHTLTLALDHLDPGIMDELRINRLRGVIATYAAGESPSVRSGLVRLREAGLPVVVHGDEPDVVGFDHVTSDQEQGGYDVTRWLISRGCTRILCFWRFPSSRAWVDERMAGYRRAMLEAGLIPRAAVRTPELHIASHTPEGFAALVRVQAGFLYEHVTGEASCDGILTGNDGQAYQAARACRLLGRIPGQDILIAGYDHIGAHCPERRFEPAGLAVTIDKNLPRIAAELINLLAARVAGSIPDPPQRRVIPHQLILPSPDP